MSKVGAIEAVLAELAEIMLPDGATVLDPAALASALAEWHERRERLAQSDDWCAAWPNNLDLRDAVLDLLLVFEDEIAFQRHHDRADAAGDQSDRRDWQEAIDRCKDLRHALGGWIASLMPLDQG
jgi:hypothetical protein